MSYKGEMNGTKVIDASFYKAISENGDLYVWNKYTSLANSPKNPTNITNKLYYLESTFKANNTVINIPVENELNGVKTKEIISNKFTKDEIDNIWYYPESGKAINLNNDYKGDKNPLYGKTIKKAINTSYVITNDNEIWFVGGEYPGYVMKAVEKECEYITFNSNAGFEYYIALDNEGKIWTNGKDKNDYGILGANTFDTGNEPICLNDIVGTELYNEIQNKPDLKFIKVKAGNGSVIAIDNYGKIWCWGDTLLLSENSNIRKSPVCLNNIPDTDLYNAHQNDSTFKIIDYRELGDSYVYIDSNNKIWTTDTNNNQSVDSKAGTLVVKRFRDTQSENSELLAEYENPDFEIVKFESDYVLGNNGKVFDKRYYNYYKFVTDGVSDIYNIYHGGGVTVRTGTRYYYDTYIAIKDNLPYKIAGVWATQVRDYVDISSSYSHNVIKINNYNVLKVEKMGNRSLFIIDDQNRLWYYYEDRDAAKVCITNDSTSNLYQKNIIDVKSMMCPSYGIYDYAIDSDNNLYTRFSNNTWNTSNGSYSNWELFTKYDNAVEKIYGEVNNENRIEFLNQVTKQTSCGSPVNIVGTTGRMFINKSNNVYLIDVEPDSAEVIDLNAKYGGKRVNGVGTIENVVGENEVQTTDGKIYRIIEDENSNITLEEVQDVTPFENPEIDDIEIEGADIIGRSKYKALDADGNLFVWNKRTGLSKEVETPVCLNNEEYYVEPIYSHGNGWSIVKGVY